MIRRRILAAIAVAVVAITAGCASRVSGDAVDTVSDEPGLIRPGSVHLGGSTVREATPIVLRAQELYTFWRTGQRSWLERAEDGTFADRTLPTGRPQGIEGQVLAAHQIRQAVPDIDCEVPDLYVNGETFTARLIFTGHFTGTTGGITGDGRAIRFDAIDIQRVGPSGKIVEDWHVEDNLNFMQQAGVVPTPRPGS